MKKIDLGRITGEKGDGIYLKMGSCTLVDTKEEAGAEILRDGDTYTLNLKMPKPIDGGGDMKLSVYDKEGKCTDIFAYIKANAMTLNGGEFKGSVYLKEGKPTNSREAVSKEYADGLRRESKDDLKALIDAINMSDLGVERNAAGEIIMYEAATIPVNIDKVGEKIEPVDELELDLVEFEVDDGQHQYIRFEGVGLSMNFNTKNSQNYSDHIIKKCRIEDENGQKVAELRNSNGVVYKLQTPGKYRVKVFMKYGESEEGRTFDPITSYTLKLNEIKVYLERRKEIIPKEE